MRVEVEVPVIEYEYKGHRRAVLCVETVEVGDRHLPFAGAPYGTWSLEPPGPSLIHHSPCALHSWQKWLDWHKCKVDGREPSPTPPCIIFIHRLTRRKTRNTVVYNLNALEPCVVLAEDKIAVPANRPGFNFNLSSYLGIQVTESVSGLGVLN
jgi:hypothetical protein